MNVRVLLVGGAAALVLAGCGSQQAAAPVTSTVTAVSVSMATVTATVTATPKSAPAPVTVSTTPSVSPDHAALVKLCASYCPLFKTARKRPSFCDASTTEGCGAEIGSTGNLLIRLDQELPSSGVDMGEHPALRKTIDDAMDTWTKADWVATCGLGGDATCATKAHSVLAEMDAVGVELATEVA